MQAVALGNLEPLADVFLRILVDKPGPVGGKVSIIMDTKSGQIAVLMVDQKIAMKMTLDSRTAMATSVVNFKRPSSMLFFNK